MHSKIVNFFIFVAVIMCKLWYLRKNKTELDSGLNFEKSEKILS